MNCPYCDNLALWCENKEIYGKNYGKSYMCYLCKDCDAYVGCHNNTRRPLGTMANKELRQERIKVHDHIDKFWKSGEFSRKHVYKATSKHIGKEYHTGECDLETCKVILQTDILQLL